MSAATVPVQQATIRQYAKRLQLAAIAGQFVGVAEQAVKAKQSHLSYLEVLLGMEVEEREHNTVARRIKEAHFPKVKTLEGSRSAMPRTFRLLWCGTWPRAAICSGVSRLFFLGKQERARLTWLPDWQWRRAGRGSGCASPPRPRW